MAELHTIYYEGKGIYIVKETGRSVSGERDRVEQVHVAWSAHLLIGLGDLFRYEKVHYWDKQVS